MALEIIGIALFAFLIVLSIALHEVGHLLPAKLFGAKVTEYMVGFGPKVWSTRRGETDYGFKAIPLGGYVRIVGMNPPVADQEPAKTAFGRWIRKVQGKAREDLSPADDARAFYRQPTGKKIITMLGGPFMNLALAAVLFGIVLVGIGNATPTLTVSEVAQCVTPVNATTTAGDCPAGTVEGPAFAAGIRPGDTITAIDGTPASDWFTVREQIRTYAGQSMPVDIERAGQTMTVQIPVVAVDQPIYDDNGVPTGGNEVVGYVGLQPTAAYVPLAVWEVPGYMGDVAVASVQGMMRMPERTVNLVSETLIGGGERAIDSPVSVVGASRLGGEIVAMDAPVQTRLASFLSLAAMVNLFLALFNLLPIMPLDGGHVAASVWEAMRRKWAAWRGQPDPGPVDGARLMPVAYFVAASLLVFGVVVIFADLVKPLSLA